MKKSFGDLDWRKHIPVPICDDYPEFNELYFKAWELAFEHINDIPGMPQTPYMDEAFCVTQLWIWDSCFMALYCKYARNVFPGVETLNNFYEVIHGTKTTPEVIPPENEPGWTHATPGVPFQIKVHIADNPPLFAWAEYENALMSGDVDYIKELLYKRKFLQKHYDWIENLNESVLLDGVALPTCLLAFKNGYKWEGGRSGMDNTPRGRTGEHAIGPRPNNPDMFWIDAICQQALSAKIISRLFDIVGDAENTDKWLERYNKKKDIVNSLYWDDKDKFYYDIDCNTNEFYKIMSIASYWTMTAEIASREQAEHLEKELFNPETFAAVCPFPSLSRSDNDYKTVGQYWRGGVWLPTAYATLKGLLNYKMFDSARETSIKLLKHMDRTYKEYSPHTIWEAYSPEEYRPATNESGLPKDVRPDFCGWSALGPISIYIEFILGFHSVNAFENVVEWEKSDKFKGKVGIKNLNFGNVVTNIEAVGNKCTVKTNLPYTLKVNGKAYDILSGVNEFELN